MLKYKKVTFNCDEEVFERLWNAKGYNSISSTISAILNYVCQNEETIKAIIPKTMTYKEYCEQEELRLKQKEESKSEIEIQQ